MENNKAVHSLYSKEVLRLKHPFHLVDSSPWPIVTSGMAFSLVVGAIQFMHTDKGFSLFFLSLFGLILSLFGWFRDIVIESTFEGHHTKLVQRGLMYGFILFIVSEVMFFFSFFWAFFHASLSPDIGIGAVWPPLGIEVFSPWDIPLLNTVILLTSGATVTWAHNGLLAGSRDDMTNGLLLTIFLGVLFTGLQGFEYVSAPFDISDSVYGSIFYMATGFHGFHVIIGTTFLAVCLFRHLKYHFTRQHHLGFEAAAYYWHFVDVVWLFLYVSIYWWGS